MRAGRRAAPWVPRVAPTLLAGATFVAGALLLLTGSLPEGTERLALLALVVPVGVIDASHLLASLVGTALVLLAWGLQRRVDAAYYLAVVLLAAGAVLAILRNLDLPEAGLLLATLAALVPARSRFDRPASLLAEPLTPGWIAAIVLVLAGTLALTLVGIQDQGYSADLWWRFTLFGDASRLLRGTVAAGVLAILWGVARLLAPATPGVRPPTAQEMEALRPVVEAARRPDANAVYMGDKAVLRSTDQRAFIMYAVQGRSWVAKGGPVVAADAATEDARELLHRFWELVDRHGGNMVLYGLGAAELPDALELGLVVRKMGEEARVPLEGFDLEGKTRAGLRRVRNRVEREGGTFEVVPPSEVGNLLPDLRRVSDAWLEAKGASEKRFSLGSFDEAYLRRFPVAVVRRGADVVAFTNLWPGGTGEELSADLVRYVPDAPDGVMDHLFLSSMLWGRDRGFQVFSLGNAPFSGLATGPSPPVWNRVGHLIYRHGEHFYNYQGLRRWKEKFDPVWEPRYLASPGGFALPGVLRDVGTLISGGVRGAANR